MLSHIARPALLLCALASVVYAQTPTPAAKPPAASAPGNAAAPGQPDPQSAYYHFALAHYYEDQIAMQMALGEGRGAGSASDLNRVLNEYRLALQADPENAYLQSELTEALVRTGHIREAVENAEAALRKDPNNLDAHRLLGRIYLRSMGDPQQGSPSQNILKKAIEQFQQITRLAPDSLEDHLLLGRLYRLNSEMAKAEEEFKTANKIAPNSEDAVTSLAYLYGEEGDYARAIATLKAVADAAHSSRIYAAIGSTYEQQKDYKHAIEAYRQAIDLDNENLDSMRGLAQSLYADGQYDAALEQYRQISSEDPNDAQALMRVAEIDRRTGQFADALEALKKAGNLVSDSLEIPYNTALVYEAQGNFDQAIQTLQQLIKRTERSTDPSAGDRNNRAIFLERLGSIYRELNKGPQAIETFQKMVDLGDDNASRGYQQLVETYRDSKQWQKAADVAREALQRYPDDRQLRITLATNLTDVGKGDEAIVLMKSLLKNSKDDRDNWIAMAQIYSRMRRFTDAEAALAEAGRLTEKNDDRGYLDFVRGSILEREKKYEAAESAFRQVIRADAHNAMALNYLGYMLSDHGQKLDEALKLIQQAIALDPENGAYLDSLGWAYFKLGNYDAAEENLRRAAEKVGNDGTVQDHLAELYARTGRLKLATAHWDRALAEWNSAAPADVDESDVARVQKKLESAKVRLAREEGVK